MLVGAYPFEDRKDPKNFRKTIHVSIVQNHKKKKSPIAYSLAIANWMDRCCDGDIDADTPQPPSRTTSKNMTGWWFRDESDDGNDRDYCAPSPCFDGADGDDDDGDYDYAPAASLEGDDDDTGYDYAPAA
ncbi:hypothetical protein LXL04_018299 [Taraxacum kok-saghyz]